jgi:hypothetical protein
MLQCCDPHGMVALHAVGSSGLPAATHTRSPPGFHVPLFLAYHSPIAKADSSLRLIAQGRTAVGFDSLDRAAGIHPAAGYTHLHLVPAQLRRAGGLLRRAPQLLAGPLPSRPRSRCTERRRPRRRVALRAVASPDVSLPRLLLLLRRQQQQLLLHGDPPPPEVELIRELAQDLLASGEVEELREAGGHAWEHWNGRPTRPHPHPHPHVFSVPRQDGASSQGAA